MTKESALQTAGLIIRQRRESLPIGRNVLARLAGVEMGEIALLEHGEIHPRLRHEHILRILEILHEHLRVMSKEDHDKVFSLVLIFKPPPRRRFVRQSHRRVTVYRCR